MSNQGEVDLNKLRDDLAAGYNENKVEPDVEVPTLKATCFPCEGTGKIPLGPTVTKHVMCKGTGSVMLAPEDALRRIVYSGMFEKMESLHDALMTRGALVMAADIMFLKGLCEAQGWRVRYDSEGFSQPTAEGNQEGRWRVSIEVPQPFDAMNEELGFCIVGAMHRHHIVSQCSECTAFVDGDDCPGCKHFFCKEHIEAHTCEGPDCPCITGDAVCEVCNAAFANDDHGHPDGCTHCDAGIVPPWFASRLDDAGRRTTRHATG